MTAFLAPQSVQYGTMAFTRTTFSDMFAPVVTITGPRGAVRVFNSSFVRVDTVEDPSGIDDESYVTDLVGESDIYADSLGLRDIAAPATTIANAPQGLFLSDDDRVFLNLRNVRRCSALTLGALQHWRRASSLVALSGTVPGLKWSAGGTC